MKVQEKLKQFQLERKAILATNFYNYETLKGILEAASRVQAPVMLQLTRSSIDYMGLKRAVVLARQGLEDYRLDGTGLMWRPNWAMCLSWDKCKIRPVLRPWKMPFVSSGLHR